MYSLIHFFSVSLPVPSQSGVVTTFGHKATGEVKPSEALNLSCSSNKSNISNLVPSEILNKELYDDTDGFKDLVNEKLKNMQLQEEIKKQKECEKVRVKAKEKALRIWHKKGNRTGKTESWMEKTRVIENQTGKDKTKGN